MNQKRQRRFGELQVISGGANPALAEDVAKECGVPLTKCLVERFPDGESNVRVDEDVNQGDDEDMRRQEERPARQAAGGAEDQDDCGDEGGVELRSIVDEEVVLQGDLPSHPVNDCYREQNRQVKHVVR